MIKKISIYDLKNCKKIINLNFSRIKKISISNIYKKNLINFSTCLIKSYCDQYIKILIESKIDKSKINKIIFIWRNSEKIPLIRNYFEYKTGIITKVDNSKVDETLKGLIKLMKFNS